MNEKGVKASKIQEYEILRVDGKVKGRVIGESNEKRGKLVRVTDK
jgi:hypothetical protein